MTRLAQRVERLEKVAEEFLCQVESCFELMNYYASGEHMKQWSRVDPQQILGEVYGRLACKFNEFKSVVREEFDHAKPNP